jgi:hypothetical protein
VESVGSIAVAGRLLVDLQASSTDQPVPEGAQDIVIEHLNSPYLQLDLSALAFGVLEIW